MKVHGDMYIYLNIIDNMCPHGFRSARTAQFPGPRCIYYPNIPGGDTMSQINLSIQYIR